MSNWIFGLQYGFCRGGDVLKMLNETTGLQVTHEQCGVLHLAYYDLELLEVADLVRYVGCTEFQANFVLVDMEAKGWLKLDGDGDWSLTTDGYQVQEQINGIFESMAHIIEDVETRRRMAPSLAKRRVN